MNHERAKRILVVEDEKPLQELFSDAFSRRGHMVEVADNGRIGFRKGTTSNYDVIICDLHMPEWNGVDAIKGILMVKPQCRFIVVSAYADRKIVDELNGIREVMHVFAKPADIDELLDYISRA